VLAELKMQCAKPAARANRGVALGALERYREALVDFEAAIAAAPSQVMLFNCGRTLALLGRHEEAIATFDRAPHARSSRTFY